MTKDPYRDPPPAEPPVNHDAPNDAPVYRLEHERAAREANARALEHARTIGPRRDRDLRKLRDALEHARAVDGRSNDPDHNARLLAIHVLIDEILACIEDGRSTTGTDTIAIAAAMLPELELEAFA